MREVYHFSMNLDMDGRLAAVPGYKVGTTSDTSGVLKQVKHAHGICNQASCQISVS